MDKMDTKDKKAANLSVSLVILCGNVRFVPSWRLNTAMLGFTLLASSRFGI